MSPVTTDVTVLSYIYTLYGALLKDRQLSCETEVDRWKTKWSKVVLADRPETASKAQKACDVSLYANIHSLQRIFATIPVSTATAELLALYACILKAHL